MAADDTIISLGVDANPAVDGLNEAAKAVKDMADACAAASLSTERSSSSLSALHRSSVQTSDAFREALGVNRQIAVSYDDLAANAREAAKAQEKSKTLASQLAEALGPVAIAATAAFSVGAIVNFGRESVAAAAQAEEAMARLRSALAAQGQAAMTGQLVELAGQLQATTRYSDDAIVSMQALASRMGVPAASMADLTKAAVDMAAALQMDVGQAGEMLAKTLDGTAGKLKELVPGMADLSEGALKAGLAFDVAGKAFRGAAIDDAATISGSLSNLSTAWGEVKESVGFAIVELTGLQSKSGGLATFLTSEVTPAIREWAEGWGIARDAMASVVDESPRLFSALSKINMLSRDWFVNDIAEWAGAGFRSVDLEGAKFGPRDGGGGSESNEAARAAQAAREQERILNEERIAARNARWAAREKDMSGAAQERQQASDAHAEQMKAARERVAEFQNAGTVAQKNLDLAWDAAGTEAQRQELLRGIVSELDKAGGAGWELVKAGELSAGAYREQLAVIDATRQGISDLAAAESARAAEQQLQREAAVRGDMFSDAEADDTTTGPNVTKQDKEISQRARAKEDSEVRELAALAESLGSVTLARQQHNEQIAYESELRLLISSGRDAEAEALMLEHELTSMSAGQLAGLVMSLGDVTLARQELAIAQAEATLQHEIETGAIDALTEAGEREIATRMRSINAMKEGAKQQAEAVRWANLSRAAKVQEVGAEINGALSSVAAVTKSTKAKIAIQATQSVINGIIETAKAASSYASGNAVAGTAHAISAATFFYAATQAGASGGGGAGGASGGGGTGRDREDAPSRTDDFSSTRQRAEEGQRMPAISVVFTGNGIIAGTTPEAFASAVTPFIQEVVRESGGREGSVRG